MTFSQKKIPHENISCLYSSFCLSAAVDAQIQGCLGMVVVRDEWGQRLPPTPRQTAQRSDKPPSSPVPPTARDGPVFHSLCAALTDSALDYVPVTILSLLAQSVYSTAQFYTVNIQGFTSLLFSRLTKAGYLTVHSHRKNTGGSRLKPFDFLPECLRSQAGSPSKCVSLPQHQGRTPLLPSTFYEQMD